MLTEILKCIHFPTQVSCVTSMSWSPEYRLAVATKQGVFIFSLTLDPFCSSAELNFHQHFIPTVAMKPQPDPLLSQDKVCQLSIEMKNRLTNDRVLAPFTPNADSFSHMRYVGWSPEVSIHQQQNTYFLLTIGFDYSFRLYYKDIKDGWKESINLQNILTSYADNNKQIQKVNMNVKHVEAPDNAYNQLFRKAYFSATLCVSWNEINRFYTGQEGGQVVFWSLDNANIKIIDVVQTKLPSVTAIESISLDNKQIVFAGSLDGSVKVIFKSGKKNINPVDVWKDVDMLKVLKIKLSKNKSSQNWHLFLCKANFVVVLTIEINASKNVVKVLSTSSINAGISHVVGLELVQDDVIDNQSNEVDTTNEDYKLSSDSVNALIGAQKGKIFLWDYRTGNRRNLALHNDHRHFSTWGVSSSPGQAVFCLLECVSSFNDHLLLREPTRLTFFTFCSHQDIREKVSGSKLLPDYLELYRSLYFKSGTIESPNTYSNENCRWWISCVHANTSESADLQVQDAEKLLRIEEAKKFIKIPKVANNTKFHAAKFLYTYCEDLSVKREAKNIMSCETWKCGVCGNQMEDEDIRSVTCISQHTFTRCGITQAPCDQPVYLTCSWCSSPYLQSTGCTRCVLCTGPVT